MKKDYASLLRLVKKGMKGFQISVDGEYTNIYYKGSFVDLERTENIKELKWLIKLIQFVEREGK